MAVLVILLGLPVVVGARAVMMMMLVDRHRAGDMRDLVPLPGRGRGGQPRRPEGAEDQGQDQPESAHARPLSVPGRRRNADPSRAAPAMAACHSPPFANLHR